MIIKITKKTAGSRLDKFLAGADSIWGKIQPSRSQIQKMIEQDMVKINGLPELSHYSLRPGDIINLQKKLSKKNQPDKKVEIKNALGHKIEIIDETSEFLVINKPAGLIVHGTAGYTLADWLITKYPRIKKVGDSADRPGIVHRLDKEVSGLMVIAKTQDSFDNLKKQFQSRTITKEYTALVHGKIQREAGLIDFPIKRSSEGYKMAAIPSTVKGEPATTGRLAETEFRIITRLVNYTLLKVKIKTGRTHQIRVHLAAYDHPVVGDKIYGTARTKKQDKKLGLNRIFLIADHLNFTDLAGEQKDFRAGLTEELENLLKIVK
ncbi:MAG: RluA family pseudouridine synthase [bacterium]|nr:RluA family pseudouridine synthase [bacterium]